MKTKLPPIKLSTSYDTAETELVDAVEEDRECPVCMESFVEGDVVSWSPSPGCDHVFHHPCIKQWLLHHECCPYCRVTVLPVDNDAPDDRVDKGPTMWGMPKKPEWTAGKLAELAQLRTQRSMTTYYCLEEGLVTLDRPPADACGDSTSKKRKQWFAMKRFLASGVQPSELAGMRGDGIRSVDDKDEEVVVVVNASSPAPTSESSAPPLGGPRSLQFAEAVVDIEACVTQLRVISNHHHALGPPDEPR